MLSAAREVFFSPIQFQSNSDPFCFHLRSQPILKVTLKYIKIKTVLEIQLSTYRYYYYMGFYDIARLQKKEVHA